MQLCALVSQCIAFTCVLSLSKCCSINAESLNYLHSLVMFPCLDVLKCRTTHAYIYIYILKCTKVTRQYCGSLQEVAASEDSHFLGKRPENVAHQSVLKAALGLIHQYELLCGWDHVQCLDFCESRYPRSTRTATHVHPTLVGRQTTKLWAATHGLDMLSSRIIFQQSRAIEAVED